MTTARKVGRSVRGDAMEKLLEHFAAFVEALRVAFLGPLHAEPECLWPHTPACRARWFHCPSCGERMSEWFTVNGPGTRMRCLCGATAPASTHAESLRLSRPSRRKGE